MSSIFSKIVAGNLPCYKVAEDEHHLAFLDIRPTAWGHTLCIPKKEVDYIFDLDNESFIRLHLFAKQVAIAIEKVVPCVRIGSTVLGLEVPHAHIHLVPLDKKGLINFNNRVEATKEEFEQLAVKIQNAFVSN